MSDEELKAFVASLERGEFEADLGTGVYKKRLARPGGGKSGGCRIIVYFKSGFRTFLFTVSQNQPGRIYGPAG
ncbi:MAG: type II toxin-antitoxin system RelE/ParE family toxin [Spirochaetaceae bacterium]|nr:type II toxin-antitoxin system RelE/ParE family toxin [Spirochaetaceae bacterium]